MLLAAKEVREANYWLRLVQQTGLPKDGSALPSLVDEGNQLTAILVASAKTARRRA